MDADFLFGQVGRTKEPIDSQIKHVKEIQPSAVLVTKLYELA